MLSEGLGHFDGAVQVGYRESYFGRLLAQEFIKVCRAGILPRLSLDQLERIA
jgi:hypothetical protein